MDIRRGIVRSFNPSTYMATVEILGSRPAYLEIPAAKYLSEGLLAEGEKVAVLFFDETNPNDAIVFAPYGGEPPSGWIGPEHIDPGPVWGASNKKLHNLFPASNENDVLRVNYANDSDFVATIASLGSNTVVYNDPTSGDENTINVASSAQLGKIVLHNTTRGTSALISSVDTATNTITLTSNVPSGWQVGDTITSRSQICTGYILPPNVGYFFDIDVSGVIGSTVAALFMEFTFYETSGSSQRAALHPYEAHTTSKRQALDSVAGIFVRRTVMIPLISQRFCLGWSASGSATASVILRLVGVLEEAAKGSG